jgi:hypothetical protein
LRQTDLITLAQPTGFMSVAFDVAAIQFTNPTISPIYFRQGGTDFPDANFADFVVPAQSLLRIPAVGKEFGYGFADTTLLALGGITTARISVLDSQEAMSAIGSVQPIARPQYYEKERHPIPVQVEFSAGLGAPGIDGSIMYVVPDGRRAKLSGAQIEISVTGFSASDFIAATLTILPNGGFGVPILRLATQATAINQQFSRLFGFEHTAGPGDQILFSLSCFNNLYQTFANIPAIEFDN